MRALALSLLVVAAVVYLLTLDRDGFLGYVNAGAEASMVGAIADWFAVTALFRHPLGLPIPHTALIPRRKDELGRGLQDFVGENFLSEEVVRERITSAQSRTGRRVARRGGQRAPGRRRGRRGRGGRARQGPRRPLEALVHEALVPRFREEPISPLLGGLLAEALQETTCTTDWSTSRWKELGQWLRENPGTVREVLGERALPGGRLTALNDRVTSRIPPRDRAVGRGHRASSPGTGRGSRSTSCCVSSADDLLADPDVQRAERLKERLLDHPAVLTSGISLWTSLRRVLTHLARRPGGRRTPPAPHRGLRLRRAADRPTPTLRGTPRRHGWPTPWCFVVSAATAPR